MKKKFLGLGLSFLLVASLVLASCAEEEVVVDEDEDEVVDEDGVVDVDEDEDEDEVVAPPVGEPQRGGTLTYFYMSQGDPTTYDTHKALWPSMVFSTPVLDGLIVGDVDQYGPVRGTGAYTFPTWDDIPLTYSKGGLVESWDVTPERILLPVAPGVLWAAYGKEHIMPVRELTAEDLVWSIHHFIDEGSAEGAPGWLWTENGGFIDSVYADGDTLVVETSRFDVRWKHWFAAGWCCEYMPPEIFAPGIDVADWMNLIGTGAFMVKEHVLGSYMAYARNPTYWDTAIIDGKEYEIPFIDELIYAIIDDESTRIAALRTASVDIDFGISAVYEETLAQNEPELVKYVDLAKPLVMALNMQSEVLSNRDVRRALIMAVDRETVNRATWGPGGDWNTFPIGSDYPDAYTPFDELPLSTQEMLTYDPVEARHILALAGYPEGEEAFELTCLLSAGNVAEEDVASMIKAYWEAIDVTLTLRTVEGPVYTTMTYSTPLEERSDNYDCVLQSDAGHVGPMAGLTNAFHPAEVSNLANFVDEYFTTQMDYALTVMDEAERDAIFKEIAVYANDQAPYLSLGSARDLRYQWPWVKNYYGEKDIGIFYFGPLIARMWIDQDLKTEMGY